MFLYISNLPHNVKVERLKQVIKEQCYVENIILDNLKDQGKKKCIMVGFMDKIDASVVLAKMDGYFFDGNKLSVRVAQQKTKQPEPTKAILPLAQPSQYQTPIPPPPPLFSSNNTGLPRPLAPPLFPAMAGALRPSAPPLFPSAGNAGLPHTPMFSAAVNSGLLPPAPSLIRAAPPLNPVALQLKPVAPQLNSVATPLNPVSPSLKPVAPASKSKTAKKLPRLKFKIAPPTQQQPSTSTSSTPSYEVQQPASIKNSLPEKNKPSQGPTIHRDGNGKSETRSENFSLQYNSIRNETKKSFGTEKTEHQNSRCLRSKSKSRSPHREPRNKNWSPHRRPRSKSRSPYRRPRIKSRSPYRRPRSKSRSPHRRLRIKSRSPHRRPRSKSRSPHRRLRSKSRSPHRRPRSKSRSPHPRPSRESRSPHPRPSRKSRSPHRRPRSRSLSPNGGRSFFSSVSYRSSRYSRDSFVSHFTGRGCYRSDHKQDRKRTRYDGRERDSRRRHSNSSERQDKRKRTESPKSEDDDRISLNRERDRRRSSSYSSDREYKHKRTISPISPVREEVTTEETAAPTIPQMNLKPSDPYTFQTNKPIVSPSNNENTNNNPNYNNNIDPHTHTTFSVPNTYTAGDGSVPTNNYYQTPIWYPQNSSTAQPIYEESTNVLHRTDPYLEVGFIPLPQNMNNSMQNVPMNSSFQAGGIPAPQNVTGHNPNVPINPSFLTSFVPPSQNSNALMQAGYVPQPQNITTFSKNVPSSAPTHTGFVPQPQNITTFSKNVPSSAPTRAGFVSQPQNITTFSKNVPSSAPTRAGFVSQPQNITTFSKNVPSSAPTHAGFVPQPQNITTFSKNVPSSAPSHAKFTPPPQKTFNESVRKLQNQDIPIPKGKLVKMLSAKVVKDLMHLYTVKFLPHPVYAQIKQIYFKRIKAIPEIEEGFSIEEAHEYYKKLYPYCNEKLVLESVLGTTVTMLDEDQQNPENDRFFHTRNNRKKTNVVAQTVTTSPPTPPPAPEQSDEPYEIKICNGVDRDQIYEAALDKELKALEQTFINTCERSNDCDINNVSEMLKQKGVHDFIEKLKIHILRKSYSDFAFVLKMAYEVEISDQNLDEFMKINNLEMLGHDKKSKLIIARCKDKRNFNRMLNIKTVQICGEILQIQRQNSNTELLFANIGSMPNIQSMQKSMATKDNTTEELEDVKMQVLECDTSNEEEHINTMPTEADQVNKQCLKESGTYNVKYNTFMEEYVGLSSAEQENVPCIEESSNPRSPICDISMEEYVNLSTSELEHGNTQCTKEYNKQSTFECDKHMGQHIHTFTNEVQQENIHCVEEPNNAQNRYETHVEKNIDIPQAKLEPESTQSIEKPNNTHITQCDKLVEKNVYTLSVEADEKNAQCIEKSNQTQSECDILMKKLVNVPAAELDSEISIEESHKKQNAECDTLTQQNVNMPPVCLKPENLQCTEKFNNTQNAERDSPMEIYIKVLPVKSELENTKCIKESNKIHNAECDKSVEELVNTLLVEVKEENTQYIKESNKTQIAGCVAPMEDNVKVHPTESLRYIKKSIITQKGESDTYMRENVKVPHGDSDLKSTKCTEGFKRHNTDNENPVEELVNTLLGEVKEENTQRVEGSNETQIAERGISMAANVNARLTELETESLQYIEKSIITQKAESDTFIRENFKVPHGDSDLKRTKCNEGLNKHNTDSENPSEDLVNTLLVEVKEENTQCVERSNKTQIAECSVSKEDNVKVRLIELESDSLRCIEKSIIIQKAESDTYTRENAKASHEDSNLKSTKCTEESNTQYTESHEPLEELVNTLFVEVKQENTQSVEESISTQKAECDTQIKEHVKIPPGESQPESTQCIELLNSTENTECIDESEYLQNTEYDTYMDDEMANTLAEIELCLQNSNFDIDNLSDNFKEIDDMVDVKPEMTKPDVVNEEILDATLVTEVDDNDLEDF